MRRRVVFVFDLSSISVQCLGGSYLVDCFISAIRRILVDSSNLLKSSGFARWGYYVFDSRLTKSCVDRANFHDFDVSSLKTLRSSLISMVKQSMCCNTFSGVISPQIGHISKALLEVTTFFHWEELSVESPMKRGLSANAHDETLLENEVFVFTCLASGPSRCLPRHNAQCEVSTEPEVSVGQCVDKLLIKRHHVRLSLVDCCWLLGAERQASSRLKTKSSGVRIVHLESLLRVPPCTATFCSRKSTDLLSLTEDDLQTVELLAMTPSNALSHPVLEQIEIAGFPVRSGFYYLGRFTDRYRVFVCTDEDKGICSIVDDESGFLIDVAAPSDFIPPSLSSAMLQPWYTSPQTDPLCADIVKRRDDFEADAESVLLKSYSLLNEIKPSKSPLSSEWSSGDKALGSEIVWDGVPDVSARRAEQMIARATLAHQSRRPARPVSSETREQRRRPCSAAVSNQQDTSLRELDLSSLLARLTEVKKNCIEDDGSVVICVHTIISALHMHLKSSEQTSVNDLRDILTKNFLPSKAEITRKYCADGQARVRELKFQAVVLIELNWVLGGGYSESDLERILSLLRMISLRSGHAVLIRFMEDELLANYGETQGELLAEIYLEMGQCVPPSLVSLFDASSQVASVVRPPSSCHMSDDLSLPQSYKANARVKHHDKGTDVRFSRQILVPQTRRSSVLNKHRESRECFGACSSSHSLNSEKDSSGSQVKRTLFINDLGLASSQSKLKCAHSRSRCFVPDTPSLRHRRSNSTILNVDNDNRVTTVSESPSRPGSCLTPRRASRRLSLARRCSFYNAESSDSLDHSGSFGSQRRAFQQDDNDDVVKDHSAVELTPSRRVKFLTTPVKASAIKSDVINTPCSILKTPRSMAMCSPELFTSPPAAKRKRLFSGQDDFATANSSDCIGEIHSGSVISASLLSSPRSNRKPSASLSRRLSFSPPFKSLCSSNRQVFTSSRTELCLVEPPCAAQDLQTSLQPLLASGKCSGLAKPSFAADSECKFVPPSAFSLIDLTCSPILNRPVSNSVGISPLTADDKRPQCPRSNGRLRCKRLLSPH